MLQTVKQFPQNAYISISSFIRAFINDERGLSGIVVAILLILVAVLAIVLIWGFLGGWLEELWDDITGNAGSIA
jgi:flagellin-like protein